MPIPNLIISTPKDSIEAGNLLYTAIKDNKPFAIRYSRDRLKYQKDTYKEIPIGSWEMLSDGKDACLITYGYLLNNADIIKNNLNGTIDLAIVNARFQKPIDEKMFKNILKKYKNIFIYEEQTYINSLGSYLVNYANELNYQGKIIIFAIPDKYIKEGSKIETLKSLGLDVKTITKKIKENME